MFACATELREVGVKFKKKRAKKGEVNCYLDVSFKWGTLGIPSLPVDETTSSKLRNFIALEQCYPGVGSHFTSYAALMDNIIGTESDVSILRKYGIIESKLGSNEEVAKMFNTLCKGTYLNYKKHYNAPLFQAVTKYYETPHHRWLASFRRKYCSSPLPIISLFVTFLFFALFIKNFFIILGHVEKKNVIFPGGAGKR
uniref:UPF0481 protein At3g47200 n=2 Tax=Anthurium amnicola TaxID=1678845 RepID=A0A1D1XXQ1_9ARAE